MLELPHVPEEKNQGVVDNVRILYVEQAILKYFMIKKFAYTEEAEEKVLDTIFRIQDIDCKERR